MIVSLDPKGIQSECVLAYRNSGVLAGPYPSDPMGLYAIKMYKTTKLGRLPAKKSAAETYHIYH